MDYNETERREFFRLNYKAPVRFKFYDTGTGKGSTKLDGKSLNGESKNISQNGILFQTEQDPPQLSSIVWMSLDMRTLKICQEIESRALIFDHGVMGKVVRVEEDSKRVNTYDIGVCFLRKDQRDAPEVRQALANL